MAKPKYPNRVYSTKVSAQRACKKYKGKGIKKIDIVTRSGHVRGYGIKW
jgi:hypothetical protein